MSSSDIQSTFIEAGAVDDDAISTSATVAEDAAMVLTASPYVPDQPRKITLHSAGNSSGITFTVVGLDETGAAATESITGGNAGSVTSTKVLQFSYVYYGCRHSYRCPKSGHSSRYCSPYL